MEEILHQAEQLEKDYDWLGAAESYKKALTLLSENDFYRKGNVNERLGYALYRSGFQAENNDMFRERMRQAVLSHEKAKDFYAKLAETERAGRVLCCDAMISYVGYWLATVVSEKKKLLDECWRLTKEILKRLDETDNALEYGKTYNKLSSSADERHFLESDFQIRGDLVREGVRYGERAITLLSKINAPHELAKAYVKTAMYLSLLAWYFVSDMDEKDDYFRKGLDYWQKANALSDETAFLELLTMPIDTLDWTIDEMLVQYGKALGYAERTKDKYLIGTALEWLKYATSWTRRSIEDLDKMKEIGEKVLQYAKDASEQYSVISYVSPFPVNWSGAPYAMYYGRLAFWETDLSKKRDLYKKAIVESTAAVKRAESAGYPGVVAEVHGNLGVFLVYLAKMETDLEEKKHLLQSAYEHINKEMKLREQLERFNYSNLGVPLINLADLNSELSQIETDYEKKKKILEEAVLLQERGLQLTNKYASHSEEKGRMAAVGELGRRQYDCGERLHLLYKLTRNDDAERKALKGFKDSAESFRKLNLTIRVAESHWKVARSHDALGEHLRAADNFNLAADNYRSAAEKIPQLKTLFCNHAIYMQAWSEIETARDHHKGQAYGLAKEHFEKAAELHNSMKKWSYLASNYSAWANLEAAEDLSRNERPEESIRIFEQAVKLFEGTQKSIQNEFGNIEDSDERQMAHNMVEATNIRREYCIGRIALEEAKILDKKGNHHLSSEKYGSAAETFENINRMLESEQERKEFKLIITLSRAWERMTIAETEASPPLYMEASQLFEKAKEFSPNEKTKMLVLGNSRFCKALEAGTKFVDTRNIDSYTDAMKCLEAASNYYTKAGFPKVSEYSRATKLLFDAYLQIDDAAKESDPEKKARLYAMAEKILQTSAGSFMKAEHPEKMEQVLELLEKVKKERELAISLVEVLHAPSITSTTNAFTTPAPTHEEAVGSERFEHADVHANVIVDRNELNVGENLELAIELANAGRGAALLDKIEGAIPDGFEIAEKLQAYRVEGSNVNMKGRRLDQLKGEDVKFSLRPKHRGSFTLKPVILYVDESGNAKSHEPEPVTIIVKELGIKGWLKGER